MQRSSLSLFIAALLAVNATAQISTPALLDTIQHAAFNYFWFEANPANGLIKDRSTSDSPCSIAATGFGLSAICIGVDHGWVTREAARDRVLATLRTFWQEPQGSGDGYIGNFGLFYHWLDMTTATRTWDSELSTIDTGLLLAGILDAKQYFSGTDSVEQLIRGLADSIDQRMNWEMMRYHRNGIALKWTPTGGFDGEWIGYNEASIMYILALGSPTYPVATVAWTTWTQGYSWQEYYGQSYVNFPPLFGHQYSHCWIDYRNIADAYMRGKAITYFENSRRATLAQRSYCITNPGRHVGYSDSLWGLTAGDGPPPTGYTARGAPPAQQDDGTIAPTAAASSIAFAPEVVIPVLHNLWNNYATKLWGQYGFRDGFNLDVDWWDTDYLGIDQGPIVIMIENYLNRGVWNRFMQSPDVQRGLQRAGFLPVTGIREAPETPLRFELAQNYPNPFNPATVIKYTIGGNRGQGVGVSDVSLFVYDLLGREVAVLVNERKGAGTYEVAFDAASLASGMYVYRLTAGTFVESRKMVLLK